MLKNNTTTLATLFIVQVVLCVYGNFIFLNRANPFVLLAVSLSLAYHAFLLLKQKSAAPPIQNGWKWPLSHGVLAIVLIVLTTIELSRIWTEIYPDPGKVSDVIPQLKGQADLFFSGQFPYVPIETISHRPYPVYLPLQWMPFQLSNLLGTDARFPGVLLLCVGLFIAAFTLKQQYAQIPNKVTLPAVVLLVLPFWGFVKWAKLDLGVSSEGVVTFWYLLLAAGLISKRLPLITLGIVGGVLSRYSLLFWLPLFAWLLWEHAPKKYSFWVWGSVGTAVLLLFVLPFLAKDPTILQKMSAHYAGCDESSWVRPDEYTYKEGLSLNIHLREWLPGSPAESLPYAHWPQLLVQLLCLAFGVWYYRKKAHQFMDIYTYALLWLALMPMLLYIFSPMVFRYYMLMPLSLYAVVCWRAIVGSLPAKATH